MLRTERHDGENLVDPFVRHVFVEEIGHGVDEDLAGLFPAQRKRKRRFDECELAGPARFAAAHFRDTFVGLPGPGEACRDPLRIAAAVIARSATAR
jgi:hypothetical protein